GLNFQAQRVVQAKPGWILLAPGLSRGPARQLNKEGCRGRDKTRNGARCCEPLAWHEMRCPFRPNSAWEDHLRRRPPQPLDREKYFLCLPATAAVWLFSVRPQSRPRLCRSQIHFRFPVGSRIRSLSQEVSADARQKK